MKLTKNFSLSELTYTNPDIQKRFGIVNEPTEQVIENLKTLSETILQPIRDHFKIPIIITSGYRNEAYNKIIGGVHGSDHTKGLAADIDVNERNKEVFEFILKNLEFGTLIWEFGTPFPRGNPDWIHVAIDKNRIALGRKKKVLNAVRKKGKTEYHIIPV